MSKTLSLHHEEWTRIARKLVDQHFAELRDEYMELIYSLGQAEVGGKKTIDRIIIKGVSMWWISLLNERCEFKSPEIYTILQLRAFERYFDHSAHDSYRFEGFPADTIAPLHEIATALQKKIEFSAITPASTSIKDHFPSLIRAVFYFLKWWLKRWVVVKKHRFSVQSLIRAKKPLFFTYMPLLDLKKAREEHRYRSNYWNVLHDYLEKKNLDCHWIWFFEPHEQQFEMYVKLAEEINAHHPENPVFFLEDFISIGGLFNIIGNYLKARIQYVGFGSLKKHFRLKGSAFNAYALLKRDTDASFAGAPLIGYLFYLEAFEKVINSVPASVGFYLWENQPWEMALLQLWKKLTPTVPIYGYQHSTLIPTDTRNFCHPKEFTNLEDRLNHPLPTQILTNSEYSHSMLARTGYPEKKLEIVEAFRYFFLKNSFGSRVSDRPIKNVLVVLGCTESDNEVQLQLISEYRAKHGTKKTDLNFILKPHPFHSVDELVRRYRLEDVTVFKESMEEALKLADLVFCAHTTTTVVETAWLGLPQIISLPRDRLNNCIFYGMKGVPFVKDLIEFEHYLKYPTRVPISEKFYCIDEDFNNIERVVFSKLLQPKS